MFLVRTASPEDLHAIAALEQNWVEEGNMIGFEPGGLASFAGYLESASKSLWVAEADDQAIVGYVSATIHEASTLAVVPPKEPHIEIDDLYVRPNIRSQSVGAKLVETVLEFARARRIRHATVFSSSSNAAQIMRFYERQGFAPWGIQFFREV